MHKRLSPAQAAKRVLTAFPYVRIGAEVSSTHVTEHFRRRGYPVSDVTAGAHYAVSRGWVERTAMQAFRLTAAGVVAGDATPTAVPPSTFDVWAHV